METKKRGKKRGELRRKRARYKNSGSGTWMSGIGDPSRRKKSEQDEKKKRGEADRERGEKRSRSKMNDSREMKRRRLKGSGEEDEG